MVKVILNVCPKIVHKLILTMKFKRKEFPFKKIVIKLTAF